MESVLGGISSHVVSQPTGLNLPRPAPHHQAHGGVTTFSQQDKFQNNLNFLDIVTLTPTLLRH